MTRKKVTIVIGEKIMMVGRMKMKMVRKWNTKSILKTRKENRNGKTVLKRKEERKGKRKGKRKERGKKKTKWKTKEKAKEKTKAKTKEKT